MNRSGMMGRLYGAFQKIAPGSIKEAEDEIDSVYQKDCTKMGWFSMLGWLSLRKGYLETACRLMKRDRDVRRMGAIWLMNYAVALSLCGRRDEAVIVLEEAFLGTDEASDVMIGFHSSPEAVMSCSEVRRLVSEGGCLPGIRSAGRAL